MYKALVNFFLRYPTIKSNSFYIAGEGYAGVFIARLVQEIIMNNQQEINQDKKINLKGVLIGNGCTHST
jgi:serine carboxypeptidase-like clade 2